MSSCDLIDFILENDRWKKIGPLNQMKSAIFRHTKCYSDFSTKNMELVRKDFKNVGTCLITDLLSPEEFEQLCQYPDTHEQIGFSQYVKEFMNGNINLIEYEKIGKLVPRLRLGWHYKIEIIIAFDTIKNVGVIVDGTHHSLALYCIKEEDYSLLERLLKRSAPVSHCRMSSAQSRTIFHEDFKYLA